MSKKYSQSKSGLLIPKPLEQPWEQAIESVAAERADPDSKVSLFDLSFPKQTEVLRHPAKRKGIFCTRRGAKSFTGGLGLCDIVETYHEVNCLYLGLTKDTAMGIIWTDILKKIDRDNNLEMHFRESKRDVTSKKGSTIFISGADADADEMQKLLGKKYKRIIIDEAQAFSIDMQTLVYGILGPTLIDQGGDIWLMGTAGNLTVGLFYNITTGKEPGWELFQWTALDNPYVAKQWQEELNDIDKNRPLFKKTALFKQWYLNQWVIDEDAKVYKFAEGRNEADVLPAHLAGWHYVLATDLAHSPDSSSFTVDAHHDDDPNLYTVFSKKFPKMDITDVANKTRELDGRFHFDVKIIDGANKQAVAELNNRHSLNYIPADKTGKADFIKLMNDDYIQGKIKLLPDTKDLKDENKKLIWVTDTNGTIIEPRKENPLIHNDCADGALYAWRYCYPFLYQKPEKKPDPHAQESWEPAHIAKMQEQVRKEQNPNEMELDWVDAWDNQDDELL